MGWLSSLFGIFKNPLIENSNFYDLRIKYSRRRCLFGSLV